MGERYVLLNTSEFELIKGVTICPRCHHAVKSESRGYSEKCDNYTLTKRYLYMCEHCSNLFIINKVFVTTDSAQDSTVLVEVDFIDSERKRCVLLNEGGDKI